MTHTDKRLQQDEWFCADCGKRWDKNEPEPPCFSDEPEMWRPVVIGITGAAGSGKTTLARHLAEKRGFLHLKFADPLKFMLEALLACQGVDDHTIRRMIEGDLKEVPSPALAGRSPRHAMQTLGTEWGRNCIDENLWSSAMLARIREVWRDAPWTDIVIDDVRFENEAEVIRKAGGKVLRLEGRGGIEGAHASEAGVVPDVTIRNDGSVERLFGDVEYVFLNNGE